jgi:hypothetical protein
MFSERLYLYEKNAFRMHFFFKLGTDDQQELALNERKTRIVKSKVVRQ